MKMSEKFKVEVQKEIGSKIIDFLIEKHKDESSSRDMFEFVVKDYLVNGLSKEVSIGAENINTDVALSVKASMDNKIDDLNDFLVKSYLHMSYGQYLVIQKRIKTVEMLDTGYGLPKKDLVVKIKKVIDIKHLHDALIEAQLEPKLKEDNFVSMADILNEKLDQHFPLEKKRKYKAAKA